MSELVEYRMHQQIAQEILYRQQMMQRLPGKIPLRIGYLEILRVH